MGARILKIGGEVAGFPERLEALRRLVEGAEGDSAYIGIVTSAPARNGLRATPLLLMYVNLVLLRSPNAGIKNKDFDGINKEHGPFTFTRDTLWTLIENLYSAAFRGLLDPERVLLVLSRQRAQIDAKLEASLPGSEAFAVGSGECMMTELLHRWLGYPILSAYETIEVGADGIPDWRSCQANVRNVFARLKRGIPFVMAGFVGVDRVGSVPDAQPLHRLLPFGGTDVTAAIVACALDQVGVLEVRKAVQGVFTGDPELLRRYGIQPRTIGTMWHRVLREAGAQPLHADAISAVHRLKPGLKIHIASCDELEAPGTWIVPKGDAEGSVVTLMNGVTGLTAVNLVKDGFDVAAGGLELICATVAAYGLSISDVATGRDAVMVSVHGEDLLEDSSRRLLFERAIRKRFAPEKFGIEGGLSIILVTGERLSAGNVDILGRVFGALGRAGIASVHHMDVGGSRVGFVVGVATQDYERAYVAIHQELFG
ncbi:MAG: aspartate kinase [Candidatus Magasanikbacteria bacterium]|nr:aspartate kinase [Candidatus Magasanikbacteria bacterium]